jgi:hypothetical protein
MAETFIAEIDDEAPNTVKALDRENPFARRQ